MERVKPAFKNKILLARFRVPNEIGKSRGQWHGPAAVSERPTSTVFGQMNRHLMLQ